MSEGQQTYQIFDWINKDYLQNVLSSYHEVTVDVTEYDVNHATTKGQGYLGAMFRAVVKYQLESTDDKDQKTLSLIIKARLENETVNEILEEYNIFERESQAYKCIIKECQKMLKETGDETIFAPRYLINKPNSLTNL